MSPESVFYVGTIGGPVGLRGELEIHVFSDDPDRFATGARVIVSSSGRTLTVRSTRRNRNGTVVAFAEVTDRAGAEALRGEELVVPAAQARELGPDEYWDHDLVGCEVVTTDGVLVGRVSEVLHAPANDVLAVRGETGETLIALVAGTVLSIEPRTRITVEPSGLPED